MKTIHIAIAGLGRTGWRNHALELAKMPDKFRVVAVTDPEMERCLEAESVLGCRSYGSFDSLIQAPDIDFVVIASPSHLHKQQAIAAMQKGRGVICEKPMATSTEDANAMVSAAKSEGVPLTVFHTQHYAPDFQQVLSVIRSGILGRIIQIRCRWSNFLRRSDWQVLKSYGGGILNNTGAHSLDQIITLLGGEGPRDLFCHMERAVSAGDAEDHVKILLTTPGQPLIDLEISSADAVPEKKWTVLGTSGGLSGDARQLTWRFFDPSSLPEPKASERPSPDRTYTVEPIEWTEDSWKITGDYPSLAASFYRDLHRSLRDKGVPAISPEHSSKVIALIQRCYDHAAVWPQNRCHGSPLAHLAE